MGSLLPRLRIACQFGPSAQAIMDLLYNGPKSALVTVALAHGAGAGMDTPFMAFFAQGLAAAGFRIVRFEVPVRGPAP